MCRMDVAAHDDMVVDYPCVLSFTAAVRFANISVLRTTQCRL